VKVSRTGGVPQKTGRPARNDGPSDRRSCRCHNPKTCMDTLTPAERSERMSRVRAKDTAPEMVVRRLVHGMGFRYRLHVRELPGNPDMVFASRGKILFMHGCFWHRHSGCRNARWPKSNLEFWQRKLNGNRARDLANRRRLRNLGWEILVIWECQLKNPQKIAEKINVFLTGAS